MENRVSFNNKLSLPDELVPLLANSLVCEYASIKRDGTPVTSPLIPNIDKEGCTVDVNTGLTYPWKAERARNNPKVCLLYSEPKGWPDSDRAIVLVYGKATVKDADLQGNTDRYVHMVRSTSSLFRKLPLFMLRWMKGYIARIWICVTPLKILWWPGGDMEQRAREWRAPEGVQVAPSDPPPAPLRAIHTPLTVEGAHLELLPSMPARAAGRACLTFHELQVKKGEMVANENYSFIGQVQGNGLSAKFQVERQLPCASFRRDPKGMISLGRMMMRMRKRLETEAARRGQPVPVVRLVE